MKVKVEIEIETDFYDEEAFKNAVEKLITKEKYTDITDKLFNEGSKLEKFDMYIM